MMIPVPLLRIPLYFAYPKSMTGLSPRAPVGPVCVNGFDERAESRSVNAVDFVIYSETRLRVFDLQPG